MDRRRFLSGATLGWLTGAMPVLSKAEQICGPIVPPGVQQCDVGINSLIAQVTASDTQHYNEWCWAACIESVFRYYGHFVSQERIVGETWGAIVNLPGQPQQILYDLNRPWTDESGVTFSVMGDVLTANPITASQDLAMGKPLIIGSMGHAMVLTGMRFVRNMMGQGEVLAAQVRDPWPGKGGRTLSPPEWFNAMFLVRIRVLG